MRILVSLIVYLEVSRERGAEGMRGKERRVEGNCYPFPLFECYVLKIK
jgi:hypothetical protein